MTDPQFLAVDVTRDPFIAECVAVDVTSALRGAEVGLRALRHRPLMRRLWESATGAGNARVAAVGSDLIAVQKATLRIVWDIVGNEERSWACLERVLTNLHAVNLDLDTVMKETSELRCEITRTQTALSELEVRVSQLREGLNREAVLRRARDQYAAGMLHPGFGPLVRGALYVAYVSSHFAPGDEVIRIEEMRTAFGIVTNILTSEPRAVAELAIEELAHVSQDALEALAYVATRQSGPLCAVFADGAKRRLAQLPITADSMREAIAIASTLEDPYRFLERRVRRPATLVEELVAEVGP